MKVDLLPAAFVLLAGCTASAEAPELPDDLAPVRGGLEVGDSYHAPQPHRDHPYAVAVSPDGQKVYVALRGSEAEPGHEVAVLDAETMTTLRRIPVGSAPHHLVFHPDGRYLVCAHRFSAYLSVIDTESDEEVQKIPVPHYSTEVLFDPDGVKAWITNRWLNSVQIYDVEREGEVLQMRLREAPESRWRDRVRGMSGVPVGFNPRGLAFDAASGRVFVANMPDLTISVIDGTTDREIDTDGSSATTDPGAPPGVTRLRVGAPVNDVEVINGTLYVATFGRGTGHPMDAGPDTDLDGEAGDGTPNVHFHDLQNEIATYDTQTLDPGPRYTSDSIVGFVDDVPDGTPGLPGPELRIVAGALPEQMTVVGDRLAVVMAGSGDVTFFDVETTGRLALAGTVYAGLFPYGIAAAPDGRTFVANRLSEDVARLDVAMTGRRRAVVGDVSGGEFPATDAEIGEAIMKMTGVFAADGDATCEHCHRESGGQRKVASAPHARSPFGLRSTPTMRYLLRTRPLMFENFLDETNFSPMMNEFGVEANFGPGRPISDVPDRDTFFIETAGRFLGRTETVGDAITRRPIDFEGAAAVLGVVLIAETRLLPNPNNPDTYAAERGRALFESPQTACAACHPEPDFAIGTDFNPNGLSLSMRMFSPAEFDGENIDTLSDGVRAKFGIESDRYGVPTLRGLWDRPEQFYHDGRAMSLLEALATPDHPSLAPGQRGVNERDGVLDIHGGTSHLTPPEMNDLIEYLLTIE